MPTTTAPSPSAPARSCAEEAGRRVLVIVDYFSAPPVYGTAVIAYHWARVLRRRGWTVDLLPVREGWDTRWDAFCRTHGIGRAEVAVRRRSRVRQALAVFRGHPPALDHVDASALAGELARSDYDAIIVIGPHLLPLAERLQRKHKVVFVPTDAISMVLESRATQRPLRLEHARWMLESKLWRRLEEHRFPGVAASVFVARADAEAATRAWTDTVRRRVHVIPNGVDAEYFRPQEASEAPGRLVFTGNLWAYDSVQGARWFIDEVLPRVTEAVPGVRFQMVGRNPAPELLEIAGEDERVEVCPNVPDIRPYLRRAEVYVCPLLSGGGVKNRLLEAMAVGRAAVATPECADALGLGDGEALRVAGGADAFAGRVIELLEDGAQRQRLGEAARAVVVERFSWEAGVTRLEQIIHGL